MARAQWTEAVDWLATAAQDPQTCKDDWRHSRTGIHLLAAGRLWDVLIVPTCLGLRAADILDGLPHPQAGPVLLDGRRQQTGFFLPPNSSATWTGPDTRYLTTGGWITAPAPHCRWGDLRWLWPPDGSGTLHAPAAMERALQQATAELARAHGSMRHTHQPPRRCARAAAGHG
ncbi:hypothetical protein ACFV2N_46685 [Streptomyces sp. NPDC059680]|uniref:hypothetical protein n=1 Tax=Streptomyces sp. NPDC059680 TaxID=3346904 RepID=UPI0036A93511